MTSTAPKPWTETRSSTDLVNVYRHTHAAAMRSAREATTGERRAFWLKQANMARRCIAHYRNVMHFESYVYGEL